MRMFGGQSVVDGDDDGTTDHIADQWCYLPLVRVDAAVIESSAVDVQDYGQQISVSELGR